MPLNAGLLNSKVNSDEYDTEEKAIKIAAKNLFMIRSRILFTGIDQEILLAV